jgi:hypothetical protein
MNNSLINRGVRWLKKPSSERSQLLAKKTKEVVQSVPFYFGKTYLTNLFLAYQPDSYANFNNHPEFDFLFKSFISHNRLSAGDIARLWSFILNIKQVLSENVKGDFAELGVWRGNTASVLAYFASQSNRRVYLFDTFEGFDKRDLDGIDANKRIVFADTSLAMVKSVIGDSSQVCDFIKGSFPESVSEVHCSKQYAIISLDCDLYKPMKAGLEFFYPLMPRGGLLMLHDYSSLHWEGAKKAIDEFCEAKREYVVLMPDKSGSAFIRKSNHD